jgi:hypothetical protein
MAKREDLTAIGEARKVIEDRLKEFTSIKDPKKDDKALLFRLKGRKDVWLSPKFTFQTPSGKKVNIRYLRDQNSIFEQEQELADGEVAQLAHINIEGNITVKDTNLRDYLILNSFFNVKYEIFDPKAIAEKEQEKQDMFDDVWQKVREKKSEDLKAVYMLSTGESVSKVNELSPAEMKVSLRRIAEHDPSRMRETLESSLLRPLFLYHFGVELGFIKHNRATSDITWVDSKKRICSVPVDADPSKHFARFLLEDDNVPVREKLEELIND